MKGRYRLIQGILILLFVYWSMSLYSKGLCVTNECGFTLLLSSLAYIMLVCTYSFVGILEAFVTDKVEPFRKWNIFEHILELADKYLSTEKVKP